MNKDNTEIAHLWAHQTHSRASGSHFYFEGDTIYSYGSHFPIARHYRGAVLFTTHGYSATTARHISITRQACSHLEVFNVDDPTRDPCKADLKDYSDDIKAKALTAGRARNPAAALEVLERVVSEANRFAEKFGFKTRFAMPDESELAKLRERARLAANRERQVREAREAKQLADAQEAIANWLVGANVSIPYCVSKVYLRVDNGELQTSKGARVPLSEAERAFRFATAMRSKGWHRNGEQFQVGTYQLDAVNEQGVIAGCHRISWDEIERFAAAQGWH